MSSNDELDDLARLHAYEHVLSSLAAMWSVNYAEAQGGLPSEAVKLLRQAIIGSMQGSRERPKGFNALMKSHIERIFTHVDFMAKYSDKGFKQ